MEKNVYHLHQSIAYFMANKEKEQNETNDVIETTCTIKLV